MKLLIVRALILFWILAIAGMSHAAVNEDVRMNLGKEPSGGVSLNPLQSGIQTQTGNSANQAQTGTVSDETLLRLLENRRDQQKQDDMAGESRDELGSPVSEKADARKSKAKKPTVLVNAEPGDGLVKLTWKLVNLPVKGDNQTLRFTIRYGIESEKLIRTLHVGTSDGYVLRELRNNQPYFIQVVATDREQLTLYKSEEIRTVPLPAEDQGSRLEKAFSKKTLTLLDKSEPELFDRGLRQFGYDFFKNSSQVLGAMDSIPVGNDYILGPGDTLSLNLWGAINARHELTVDRTGEIMIPKVGVVKVWGLSYDQGRDAINKAVGRYYKNFEMSLTLGRLRTIQVFVVGEVEAPGSYSVSSLSTVINALSAAGGPSRNGSLRTIKITRSGQAPQDVDLYDMFLSGDRSKDVRLQNGDTIFVPVIGPVVAVAGEVRPPAIYEIKRAATLPDVLGIAGCGTVTGYPGRVQVERVTCNDPSVVLAV